MNEKKVVVPEWEVKFLCPTCNQELKDGNTIHVTASVRPEPKKPARKTTFIPSDRIAEFSQDEPEVSFEIGGRTEVSEAIRDIHAWCDVYFGDNPELQNLKDNVSKAYRRGQRNPK